jgi:hypothetical protein
MRLVHVARVIALTALATVSSKQKPDAQLAIYGQEKGIV